MLNLRSLRAMLKACDLDDNSAARCIRIADKATRIERNLPHTYQDDPGWRAEIAKLERLRGEIVARDARRQTAIAFLRENAETVADLFGEDLAPERRAGVVERLQAADLSTIGDTLRTIDRVLRDRAPEKPAPPTWATVRACEIAFRARPSTDTLRALAGVATASRDFERVGATWDRIAALLAMAPDGVEVERDEYAIRIFFFPAARRRFRYRFAYAPDALTDAEPRSRA